MSKVAFELTAHEVDVVNRALVNQISFLDTPIHKGKSETELDALKELEVYISND